MGNFKFKLKDFFLKYTNISLSLITMILFFVVAVLILVVADITG